MTAPTPGRDFTEAVYGVRKFDGADIHYRVGTVDEFLLDHEYVDLPLFVDGYSPPATDTILDVGAHIGIFSVLAAQRVPQGKVYGIEPDPRNFDVLRQNIEGNSLSNAVPCRVALGSTSGTVRLYHGPESWSPSIHLNDDWSATYPRRDFGADFDDVPAQTLEEFFIANQIRVVNYMKMNIEGAEYNLFAAASPDVLRSIEFMHIEMHPAEDRVSDALLDKVRATGFTVDVEWSDNPHVKCWLTAKREL